MYRALRDYSCGSRGFLEDRMMDIITGRVPPPARAESEPSQCLGGNDRTRANGVHASAHAITIGDHSTNT